MGLQIQFSTELDASANVTVIDQFPKPGTSVVSGSYVTIYYDVSPADASVQEDS